MTTTDQSVRPYGYAEVAELLPHGAITKSEWDEPEAAWIHDMPWERVVDELQGGLPEDIIWLISKIAEVEDNTSYYQKYLSSIRGLGDDRVQFRDRWVPQELVHGMVGHVLWDVYHGHSASTRIEQNELAAENMGFSRRVGSAMLRGGAGLLIPSAFEAAIHVKGYSNEQSANAVYRVLVDWLYKNGFPHTAELFVIPAQQEMEHAGTYLAFAQQLLEGNTRRQKMVRKVVEGDDVSVGDEIRTPEESARMVRILHGIGGSALERRAEKADSQFQKRIPGMRGVTPFQNRLVA